MPKRIKVKRTICSVHDEIYDFAYDIEALIDDLDILKKHKTPILSKLKKIKSDAKEAKEYGQRMEDRMSEYRYAIEELGFVRKKT